MRVPGPAGVLLLNLPERIPPASGLQAATVIPRVSAMGSNSRSMSRCSRLYGTCRPVKAVQPCHWASVLARAMSQAGVSEMPT